MQKKNVTNLSFCYGCGVCEIACPHKIINIRLNENGFYAPQIDDIDKCTECGFCLSVCAHNDSKVASRERDEIKSYASWSNDELTRLRCSSGGIGFEIGKLLLQQGYKIVACRFNVEKNRAEHFLAETEEEFRASVGSKYIPSFTVPGFLKLNRNNKFFVTGTPCQIDSLRRWARKMKCEQNFVFLDFFCHGAPSMNLWKKYSSMREREVGTLEDVSWRNKATGWHDSWAMGFRGGKPGKRIVWSEPDCLYLREKKTLAYHKLTDGDIFYGFFLGDVCFGRACYETCKYKKGSSAADIRIGDLWGKKYAKDENGVSVVLSMTKRGDEVLKNLSGAAILVSETFDTVTEGQMTNCAHPRIYTPWIHFLLKTKLPLKLIWLLCPYAYRTVLAVCYRKFKKLIKNAK